jgi:hydroxypyruvate isomerase
VAATSSHSPSIIGGGAILSQALSRKEPTTGEINYRNIFKWLHDVKKYDGVLGMEHGNSQKGAEGEQAVIAAYRACDNF